MREDEAKDVVEALRRRGVMSAVVRPATYRFGVRVPLGDGREAWWDTDGAAGLEAQIMRDGQLVGFLPPLPGSESLSPEDSAAAIAAAEYPPS